MAQDFFAAFHLDGESDTTINSLDIDGINMAGIQALKIRTDELSAKTAEIDALKNELEAFKKENAALLVSNENANNRITKLETAVSDLTARLNQWAAK